MCRVGLAPPLSLGPGSCGASPTLQPLPLSCVRSSAFRRVETVRTSFLVPFYGPIFTCGNRGYSRCGLAVNDWIGRPRSYYCFSEVLRLMGGDRFPAWLGLRPQPKAGSQKDAKNKSQESETQIYTDEPSPACGRNQRISQPRITPITRIWPLVFPLLFV